MKHTPVNNVSTLSLIQRNVQTLKREIERLTIRILAIQRFQRHLTIPTDSGETESTENGEFLENFDALLSDMTTYKQQLEDKLTHITHGFTTLQSMKPSPVVESFAYYIYEDIRLIVRDAKVAREGYNELLSTLLDRTNHSD
jgi:hypothetical protein